MLLRCSAVRLRAALGGSTAWKITVLRVSRDSRNSVLGLVYAAFREYKERS
jgi:hypothetical protein